MASQTVCEPCSYDGKQNPAIKWCMECQEEICKDCAESHRKIKQVRNHRLIDIDRKVKIVKIDVKKCKKHPTYEEEYYCADHDVTCCRDCLAKEHKVCPRTVSVESASVGIRQSEILSEFATKTTVISTALDDIIQFCEANKQELETDADKIRDEIDRLEDEYIKHIQDKKRSFLDILEKSKHEKEIKLKKKSEEAQSVKASVDIITKELNFIQENGSEKQLFLFLRQSESNLSECENGLQSTLSETHQVNLSFNKLPFHKIEIGSVKVNETKCSITYVPPKHYQAQSLMPIDLRLETFELVDRVSVPHSVITGMAVTEDDKLLVCNRSGGIAGINVFDQNNKLCNTIKMKEEDPWDITLIPDNSNTAVVTFDSNQIQFLDTKSLQPGKVVTLRSKTTGIASTKENIFVGSDGEILVLTIDGTLQRTISLPDHGTIRYIHVDSRNIIHCAGETHITCITTDGKLLYTYKIDEEANHRSIVTDRYGYVFILDRKINQIVRLTPDGSMDRVILNKDNVINEPMALCFNKSCDKLYVSNYGKEEILIFKCN